MSEVTVACVQMNSTDEVSENIEQATTLIRQAASEGATLIALPENAFLMATGAKFQSQVYPQSTHPAVIAMQQLAKELNAWILIGSVMCREEGEEKCWNRSILINAEGAVAAIYNKIHLFDVTLPSGEQHFESHRIASGAEARVVPTPAGKLGMSVCYDVRFPYLYRDLAHHGAEILSVPAAFTRFTGSKGGWHVLNRARAMENGTYVIAPAQVGTHPGASGRQTYGHSLIIDPWGTVLAEASGDAPGVILATIETDMVAEVRQIIPSLQHDREFSF